MYPNLDEKLIFRHQKSKNSERFKTIFKMPSFCQFGFAKMSVFFASGFDLERDCFKKIKVI